jgi:tetratricopeptide (TPR) repeat protein
MVRFITAMIERKYGYSKAKAARLMVVLALLVPLSAGAQESIIAISDLDTQAVACEKHQQWGKAQQLYTEILHRQQAILHADDIRLIKHLNDVVRVNCIDGKCSTAIPYLEQLLKIRQKHFGPYNTEIAISYLLLGEAYEKMHDYDRACTYFRQAVQMQAHLTGANSNDTIGYRVNIIRSLKEKEDYAGAKKETAECLSLLAGNKNADTRLKSAILDYQKDFGSMQLR